MYVFADVMRTSRDPREPCCRGAAPARGLEEKPPNHPPSPLHPIGRMVESRWPPRNEGDKVTEIDQSTGISRRRMMQAALAGGAGALALPAFATGGAGRVDRQVPGAPEVAVRLRQPRDDEPVLRADALRRRGRVHDDEHHLPVDGLADGEDARDDQRDEHGDLGQGRRHRGLRRRPEGVRRPDRRRRSTPASRSSPTTPTARPPTSGSPTSARTSSTRASRWASASPTLVEKGGRIGLFIATPGQSNIQPRIDGAQSALKGKGYKIDVITTGADLPGRALEDRRLRARATPTSRASSPSTPARPRASRRR